MSKVNENLDECLEKLFEKSGNFKVSIKLIQKLAQQLKLETFIDKHAFSMNTDPVYQELRPQRLSIAGSLILIDIDFTGDSEILNVELSVGNHMMEKEAGANSEVEEPDVDETEENGTTKFLFDFEKRKKMFLGSKQDGKRPVSEEILLDSLRKQEFLGTFPQNLKYLADLDKLSTNGVDVFQVIDEMTFVLEYLYEKEKSVGTSEWGDEEGWNTMFGRVYVNDVANSKLGVLLDFWQDSRHVLHEYESRGLQNSDRLGKIYRALIGIENKNSHTYPTVIDEPEKTWISTRNNTKYTIKCKNGIYQSSNDNSMTLKVDFTEPIILPVMLIEYLGIVDVKRTIDTSSFITTALNDNETLTHHINLNGHPVRISLIQNLPTKFTAVNQISISRLNALTKIIPCIRNFLVLRNLIESLKGVQTVKPTGSPSNAEAWKEKTYSDVDLGQNSDAKQKLKESLKLSNDVTDEELLGLSAMTRNKEVLDTIRYDDLDLFMTNDESKTEDEKAENNAKNPEDTNYLNIYIQEVDFESELNDLIIQIQGTLATNDIDSTLKISNGTITLLQSSDDMEVDDDNVKKLAKGLGLTENIVEVIKFIYFK